MWLLYFLTFLNPFPVFQTFLKWPFVTSNLFLNRPLLQQVIDANFYIIWLLILWRIKLYSIHWPFLNFYLWYVEFFIIKLSINRNSCPQIKWLRRITVFRYHLVDDVLYLSGDVFWMLLRCDFHMWLLIGHH